MVASQSVDNAGQSFFGRGLRPQHTFLQAEHVGSVHLAAGKAVHREMEVIGCCLWLTAAVGPPLYVDTGAAAHSWRPRLQAISGDKAKDKSQGELSGVLKKMGYTSDQVYKF